MKNFFLPPFRFVIVHRTFFFSSLLYKALSSAVLISSVVCFQQGDFSPFQNALQISAVGVGAEVEFSLVEIAKEYIHQFETD